MNLTDTSDLYRSIFLTICKYLAISILTIFASEILEPYFSYNGCNSTYICLIITNCTGIIVGKLNRILERLPKDDEQSCSN